MEKLTKKNLIEQLKDVPDDAVLCIHAKTPLTGNAVYMDVELEPHIYKHKELIILTSEGLNLTIESDTELIKDGVEEL